jgi:hypothetical protein
MCRACQERVSLIARLNLADASCERAACRLSATAAAAIPVRPIRANALLILINARSRSLPFNYTANDNLIAQIARVPLVIFAKLFDSIPN